MKPKLYESTEQTFSGNGIGILSDAVSCTVTEERNGAFELEMQYPISGIHYSEIKLQRLILAKPNQTMQTQPFRIYKITKPMNGIVSIFAEHISYDLSGIPISPFVATSASQAMALLKQKAVGDCPFTFLTDKDTEAIMKVTAPCSLRSQLGGKTGSVLDTYGGGEYTFDRFTVRYSQHRGQDNGVTIRYGKNLTDIKQEENCTKVYSAVYPYWVNSETGDVKEIDGKTVPVDGTFPVQRILTLDFSQEFESEPTDAQLISRAQSYINANGIGIPSINLDVSFVQLEQSDEYKGMALLERVSLCDTVTVYFSQLGVNATAKAISLVYNVLLDRVEKITLGDAKTRITDTIMETQQISDNAVTEEDVGSIVTQLTASILGADGGSVRLLDTNDDGVPDTLYIADNADPEQAVKVWRFNYQGWGASTNGYNGPYTMGATLAQGMVADFITAGQIDADSVSIGGTGTTIDGTSVTVVHSTLGATIKTVIDENGLLFMSGNTILGGLMRVNNAIASAVQTLYNPSVSTLNVQIGSGTYGSEDGLTFKLGTTECFELNAINNGFRMKTSDNTVFLYASSGGLTAVSSVDMQFRSSNGPVKLDAKTDGSFTAANMMIVSGTVYSIFGSWSGGTNVRGKRVIMQNPDNTASITCETDGSIKFRWLYRTDYGNFQREYTLEQLFNMIVNG